MGEAAYKTIRRAILWCDLAPAERVTEAQLAGQYGLGRAAVRAALTRLAHERLVTAIPRHGYAVAPITFQSVQELFGVRAIIEPAAAKLAASHVDAKQLAGLQELNEAYRVAQLGDDPATLRQTNTAFHIAVARASGNARLAAMVESTLEELNRVLYLPQLNARVRTEASVAEHERIIEALRARDDQAAGEASAEHIAPNRQFVIDGLISSPRLRSLNLVEA